MSNTTAGLAIAIGIPLLVLITAIVWPQRVLKDKTVQAISRRIKEEDGETGR
ncbi:hypothetical protein [Nocardia mexicana]|uniref:Uncharacterized protein n=1 Tax=Nocardia mexicana TaxID=279262 RepID=A0A370GNZ9_9NOCA|nr:hypothetical protein [Nocardia mexicana]RDI44996.1 hypothetical protein DFR68_11417 [Nocardia mexicana]